MSLDRRANGASSSWRKLANGEATPQLALGHPFDAVVQLTVHPGLRAIEDDDFPFEQLSDLAEAESWRKEINRPTTHIHKWWAQRLGTVFRAMMLGAFAPSGTDVFDLFHKPVRVPRAVVFDPFMGSGTTMAEVVKLGARGIGRDINPVAHFLVKCALSVHDRKAIVDTFHAIECDVAEQIRGYYRTTLDRGEAVDVLYYFWVMTVACPSCSESVDLFSSRIFARHANARKFPKARAVCPHCGGIEEVQVTDEAVCCASCAKTFDVQSGTAHGQNATCPSCAHRFAIAKTIRAGDEPPHHRLYAKLVLMPDGTKAYLPATPEDEALYQKARQALAAQENPYPKVAIEPGYNTNQALGYNYRCWHEMFNDRQLLCLSLLADHIGNIPDQSLRELFTCLFSGALEFNNLFASYKGEGTGAVRHAFSHHILKPERVPLEANPWGTPKSSGSFSTLFQGRIRRALDYAEQPFELRLADKAGKKRSEKVYGLSEKIGVRIAQDHAEFADERRVYLSCGDSSTTDLPAASVDAVLTDPPFFDNVHYSQLADFFHVWQRHILGEDGHRQRHTTRSQHEVQNADADDFTDRLGSVWREVHRVLKDDGLLVFTYHHSRGEGWRSVLCALVEAGFHITAAHPIKAEMSVAMPKRQAREPINLDIILVCRKYSRLEANPWDAECWDTVTQAATMQTRRFIASGRRLSRNDVRVIVMAQLLRRLSTLQSVEAALQLLDETLDDTEALIERLHAMQAAP